MKLKILGSSSSGNCYLLEAKNETLILECGLPYKTILKGLNFDLNNVVGCLVTHEHKDHSKGYGEVLSNGIDVWLSEGTMKATCNQKHNQFRFPCLCESEKQFKIGEFTILPFQAQHDAAEPLGFLMHHPEMGKLLFITDSYYCKYNFKGLNHILIECNYSNDILKENLENGSIPLSLRDRIIKSHFELGNVKEFLKATDLKEVKEITLIHLSESNSNATQFKGEIEGLTGKPTYVANRGLELDLL